MTFHQNHPVQGIKTTFPIDSWFSRKKEDGQTVKKFDAGIANKSQVDSKVPLDITIVTGDLPESGTDYDLNLTLHQKNNGGQPITCLISAFDADSKDWRFERGLESLITKTVDAGITPSDIMFVQASLVKSKTGKSLRSTWCLERVEVRFPEGEVLNITGNDGNGTWIDGTGKTHSNSVTLDNINGRSRVDQVEYRVVY